MSAATATPTRLHRSTTDKKIAGVCGGIAHAMGWDPTTVRLAFALSMLLPGPQVLAYLVAWVVMPAEATDGDLMAQAQPAPADEAVA